MRMDLNPQTHESANVFETNVRKKTAAANFFSAVSSGIWFSRRPGLYPCRAAEEPAVGSAACSKNTHPACGRHARPRLDPGRTARPLASRRRLAHRERAQKMRGERVF